MMCIYYLTKIEINVYHNAIYMTSYTTSPSMMYDIETGNRNINFKIETLEKKFDEFKEKTEKTINQILQVTHPPCAIRWCTFIWNIGINVSYILLWLIVFHKI